MRFPALLALLALSLSAADPAGHIVFIKEFPKSTPDFMRIVLDQEGNIVYQDQKDDSLPLRLKVPEKDTAAVFALAQELDHFRKPLESGLNVAFMGKKTLRFEAGNGTQSESTFNYSNEIAAQRIADFFERVNETAQLYFMLERAAKFEKLGVNDALLKIESSYDKGRLVGYDLFQPLLQRVMKSTSYLNMARDRASYLSQRFQNPDPPPQKK